MVVVYTGTFMTRTVHKCPCMRPGWYTQRPSGRTSHSTVAYLGPADTYYGPVLSRCEGTVSRLVTRKAGLQPLMPSSWPPSERTAAVPYHEDLLDATFETICGRGHGSTRLHKTSRSVPICDTLSDQYDRGGDGACAHAAGAATRPPFHYNWWNAPSPVVPSSGG